MHAGTDWRGEVDAALVNEGRKGFSHVVACAHHLAFDAAVALRLADHPGVFRLLDVFQVGSSPGATSVGSLADDHRVLEQHHAFHGVADEGEGLLAQVLQRLGIYGQVAVISRRLVGPVHQADVVERRLTGHVGVLPGSGP